MSQDVLSVAGENVAEIKAVLERVDSAAVSELVQLIEDSPNVFFQGSGRTLLMMKAVAMRLMHLGLPVHVVGEVLTPAIGAQDLLVAVSARGGATTHATLGTASAVGARVAVITTRRENIDADIDLVVTVPARTEVASAQHAGSLFEQSLLVIGDAICRTIQRNRDTSTAVLDARHANL